MQGSLDSAKSEREPSTLFHGPACRAVLVGCVGQTNARCWLSACCASATAPIRFLRCHGDSVSMHWGIRVCPFRTNFELNSNICAQLLICASLHTAPYCLQLCFRVIEDVFTSDICQGISVIHCSVFSRSNPIQATLAISQHNDIWSSTDLQSPKLLTCLWCVWSTGCVLSTGAITDIWNR